jgi:Cof subfamily protein (haloacid dehalogenase superfamily)
MSRPVICFDLDGTLVDQEHVIHSTDREILAQRRDIILIPASGRNLNSVRLLFNANELFREEPIPIPMVLQNGSVLYTPGERLQAHHTFQSQIQTQLIQILRRFPEATYLFLDLDDIYILNQELCDPALLKQLNFVTRPFEEEQCKCLHTKVMCLSADPMVLAKIDTATKHLRIESAYSLPSILEFNPPGIHKGKGLADLLKILNLVDCPIVAVGDGDNDIPLFERAQVAFAPQASPAHIRARVDHVLETGKAGIFLQIISQISNSILPIGGSPL